MGQQLAAEDGELEGTSVAHRPHVPPHQPPHEHGGGPAHTRQEEQRALLDTHRGLTAQLQALNERFHALDAGPYADEQERQARLLAILDDELEVLRQARELDGDIHRLFLDEAPPLLRL
jgi:hypothetical protein